MGKNVRDLPGGQGQNFTDRREGEVEHAPGWDG